MVTRGLYSYLIFTQKIVNRAKKGVLHGTPKFFLKVSQDVFTMHNTQSTKINRKINFILHGLATRRLSVKKKVTRNRDFSRPAETDPYAYMPNRHIEHPYWAGHANQKRATSSPQLEKIAK